MKKHLDIMTSRKALVGLATVAVFGILTMWVFDFIGEDRFRALIEAGGLWAPLVYIGFKAMTYIIAPLSGGPIVMLSGTVFGPWLGTLYSILGDLLGGSVNFWISKLLGRPVIARLAGKKSLEQIDDMYDTVGQWRGLLFARVALSGLYDIVSYAAGLTKLPFYQYFLVSLLGSILPTFYSVYFGATLVENRPLFFVILAIMFVLIGLQLWLTRHTNKKKS